MEKFKKQYTSEHLNLERDFEVTKRIFKPDRSEKVTFRIPAALIDIYQETHGRKFTSSIENMQIFKDDISVGGQKMRINAGFLKNWFWKAIQPTLDFIKEQLLVSKDLTITAFVGEFAESPMLTESLKQIFTHTKVIEVDGAGLAVLRGSVIMGHKPKRFTFQVNIF